VTAPTEGRFTRPERRWGCCRGTFPLPLLLRQPKRPPLVNLCSIVKNLLKFTKFTLQISNLFHRKFQNNCCHQKRSFQFKCITNLSAAGFHPDPFGPPSDLEARLRLD